MAEVKELKNLNKKKIFENDLVVFNKQTSKYILNKLIYKMILRMPEDRIVDPFLDPDHKNSDHEFHHRYLQNCILEKLQKLLLHFSKLKLSSLFTHKNAF